MGFLLHGMWRFIYCWCKAVGGEASTIEDLGEGPDNAERYRKTVCSLADVVET